MATNTIPLFNTDPNVQAQAALIQQRLALAQALQTEGLKPLDISNRSVGGVAYHVSPFEGLAKMLQAYVGSKGVQDATQQQAGLAGQAYGALLDKYQPGQATYSDDQRLGAESAGMDAGMGPPDPQKYAAALLGQQPANQNVNPNNPLGMPAQLIAGYTAGMIPKEVYESQAALYKPTDATLTARQGGMDQTQANRTQFQFANTDPTVRGLQQAGLSPQQIYAAKLGEAQKGATDPKIFAMHQAGIPDDVIQKIMLGQNAKDAVLPARPGQAVYGFGNSGVPQLDAVAPDPNSNQQYTVGPNGTVAAQPVPGAVPAKASLAGGTAGATAAATAPHQIIELWDPVSQRNVKVYAGNILPPAGVAATPSVGPGPSPAGGGAQRKVPPATQAARDSDIPKILRDEMTKAQERLAQGDPRAQQDIDALTQEMRLHKVSAPAGAALGETDQMKDMTERFGKLRTQASEAQNTISYLQGIKQMAPGAATGQFSDKAQFVNSLLAPFSEKANNEVTAKQLLDKYSNQIVARLGQGGLGTDAARAILQSAYPNSHMTKEAIAEAADNLIGAQNMTMAKTQLLAPLHNARNTAAYQQTEQKFDQLADPRLWQLRDMDAASAKHFLSRLPPKTQQDLRQRAVELQKMGAL